MIENSGNVIFENFVILDSKIAGFSVLKTNHTKENTLLRKSVFVGKSENVDSDEVMGANAIFTPITESGLTIESVTFVNFDQN